MGVPAPPKAWPTLSRATLRARIGGLSFSYVIMVRIAQKSPAGIGSRAPWPVCSRPITRLPRRAGHILGQPLGVGLGQYSH